ncbi:putative Golgi reassembly stacking protein [Aspergillus brunneoviolaceus CBS 621.78]|uniref:Uncharacterized protein n=1 Tax=Aspergillus brunneoviolaceus CBS 621.78 TaxID=1450534 RepID=A0ACD1GI30_9EURO|nr:hypothetical protein BO95DRAFT_439694 [Aspergillus brunneoviolaceus CBS 621.78]RAH48989.1 hypothetical protein BO95DRAFT_439694 [Aspergillus brunneoviolaceus CBS 621.78]
MFGAFNRFIGLEAEPAQQPRSSTADNSFGFQVLRNKDPEVPLEPWFDFIIGINGRLIEDPDPHLFATEVRNCAGSSVTLEVWSAKGQKSHSVSLPVPATPTGTPGPTPTLGLAVQLAPLSSTQNIWHVLSIPSPLSPAYRAGLLPHSDYIIGTPSGTLRGESALGELVEDHLDRTLVLWVYNSEFDVVREVELIPTRGWGGEGALGAELGFGALHRLPVGLGEEVEGPGEVVFENAPLGSRGDGSGAQFGGYGQHQQQEQQPQGYGYGYGYGYGDQAQGQGQGQGQQQQQEQHQFLVPANLSSPPPPPMVGTPTNRVASPATTTSTGAVAGHGRSHRKARAAPSPSAFDEYFAEGLEKSKELDYAPSSRKGTPLPPPPKKGGGGAVQSPPPPPVTSGSPSPAAE